jgi:hypothetical protein
MDPQVLCLLIRKDPMGGSPGLLYHTKMVPRTRGRGSRLRKLQTRLHGVVGAFGVYIDPKVSLSLR